MENATPGRIMKLEERLRMAMLQSNVPALEELLAPDLLFTNHLGQIVTKTNDLDAHRSGTVEIEALKLSDLQVRVTSERVMVASARARLEGRYQGKPASGDFRFTRVWACSAEDVWQVVAGHSSMITT